MRDELSDKKFIEWTSGRKNDSWDIQYVSEILNKTSNAVGLDVGGGIGSFSKELASNCQTIKRIDVVDPSISVRDIFTETDNEKLISSYFENYEPEEKYDFILLNLVLHHIIRDNNTKTTDAQKSLITKACSLLKKDGILFVEENFFDSFFGSDITGRLIYEITKLKCVAKIIRLLGANTAGEGVRFRSQKSWDKMFLDSGLRQIDIKFSPSWGKNIHLYQRIPILCTDRYQAMKVFDFV